MIGHPNNAQIIYSAQITQQMTLDAIKFAHACKNWAALARYADNGYPELHNLLGRHYLSQGSICQAAFHFAAFIKTGDAQGLDFLKEMTIERRWMTAEARTNAIECVQLILEKYKEFNHQVPDIKYHLALLLENADPGKAAIIFDELCANDNYLDSRSKLIELLYKSQAAQAALGDSKTRDYLRPPRLDSLTGEQSFAYAEHCANSEKNMFRDGPDNSQYDTALIFYNHAYTVGQHKLAGFKCKEMMAIKGDLELAYEVGIGYLHGINDQDVPIDQAKAERYLMMTAEGGHGPAAYILFDLVSTQRVQSDALRKAGADYFLKIVIKADYYPGILMSKAHSGDSDAAYSLYLLLAKGDERWKLSPDINKAFDYLWLAIHLKHKEAGEEPMRLSGMPAIELYTKEHRDSYKKLLKKPTSSTCGA